jgi:hypothetical protein
MLSLRHWLLTGCAAAGMCCISQVHAGDFLNHGCVCGQLSGNHDPCANIPPGTQPAPPGTYLNKIFKTQYALAEMDDFVFYRHMWLNNGTELGPLGRYMLDLITRRLPTVPFPVVIETSRDNDRLDTVRRDVILSLLAARGFSDPKRVIVGYSNAEGLNGDEVFRVYNGIVGVNDPQRQQNQGQGQGGAGGFFGGPGFNNGGAGAGFGGFGGGAGLGVGGVIP